MTLLSYAPAWKNCAVSEKRPTAGEPICNQTVPRELGFRRNERSALRQDGSDKSGPIHSQLGREVRRKPLAQHLSALLAARFLRWCRRDRSQAAALAAQRNR